MYKVVGSIIFWLISVSAFAQVQITLTDKVTGETLPGVSLHIRKAGQPDQAIAISNEAGVIGFIPASYPVKLIVSSMGYSKHELNVTEAGTYKIELTPDVNQLDQVVVTGQFEPQSVRQSVYQVRTIDNAMIKQRNATNVQSILNTELGVRFSNDLTLGTSSVTLMGMGGQNVKILLDGVPMLDRGETKESLNQIDINSIDRIEIVEGPMSVIYGTDALAGVINIITKKSTGNRLSVNARVLEETVADEYQAFSGDGVHTESVGVNWEGKAWYAGGSATRNNFGGWQGESTGRSKEWNSKDQWLGAATLGYKFNNLDVWYRINYLNESILTLGDVNALGKTTDKEYITNRYTHQAQTEWMISDKWNFNGAVSRQDYSRRTLTTDLDVNTGKRTLNTEEGAQDESIFSSMVFRGAFVYKLIPAITVQPGFDVNLNKGLGDRIDGEREINDFAVFLSTEIKLTPAITIRPGLRTTYNSVYDAPPVIPSVNTKIALSKSFDLRLSYARGFRAPSLQELYFSFHDASHDIDGNPDLKAEYSNSFTGSVTWKAFKTPSVSLVSVLSGFYNNFKNQITTAQDSENSSHYTYVNILDSRTTGVTWNNMFKWKGLSANVGASYIGAADPVKSGEGIIELMWSTELNSTVSYSFEKIGTVVSLYYKATGKRTSYEYYTDDAGESQLRLAEQEDFQWVDVTVNKTLLRYLTVGAGVKNVFDVTWLRNTSLDVSGAHSTGGSVPMGYGRSYFVSLSFQLNKK